ncbi:hydroxyacylglutathione hydrolase [Fluviispira multicolorata]|uniref:Hydroxyacylglutathione hydrolase n=1 Tax=Fluviispira multicolorata TaxID=2654512 RepID=A0A833JFE1_9BACT|nr:hydroxyacylglutathione hydrolase [Fluviispira multicolorata]KAB8030985.1 hydroxyacylglutathione hydrolase [Fluviispira multicolorata]
MKIELLPALNDNYIFILIDEFKQEAAVIDPAEADPVLAYLKNENLILTKIFNTHHHADHIGGNKKLSKYFPDVEIYASANDSGRIGKQDYFLKHGDKIQFANEVALVYFVPGHTIGHICYHFSLKSGENHLFIGDTIFSGGCGKIFEGTFEQMFSSLKFIRDNIPDYTYIWCAHEYTLENYLILEQLEPDNLKIKNKIHELYVLKQKQLPSIPFQLSDEKNVSSFLRWDDPELRKVLSTKDDLETFIAVRKYRDNPPKIKIPF